MDRGEVCLRPQREGLCDRFYVRPSLLLGPQGMGYVSLLNLLREGKLGVAYLFDLFAPATIRLLLPHHQSQ